MTTPQRQRLEHITEGAVSYAIQSIFGKVLLAKAFEDRDKRNNDLDDIRNNRENYSYESEVNTIKALLIDTLLPEVIQECYLECLAVETEHGECCEAITSMLKQRYNIDISQDNDKTI